MQSEKIDLLATALCEAQKVIKSAHKDSENPFFKSKYADLTSTWEACKEALTTNGLSVVQTMQGNTLETVLLHKSGQWISGNCPLINLKGDMQGLGSSISYARRYSLAAIVGVTADDDDAQDAGQSKPTIMATAKPSRSVPTIPAPNNPGDYICKVKKFQGKKLSDIQDFEILGYIDWLKTNTDLKFPEQKEYVKYAEAYLNSLSSKRDPSEPPPVAEDLNPNLSWNK